MHQHTATIDTPCSRSQCLIKRTFNLNTLLDSFSQTEVFSSGTGLHRAHSESVVAPSPAPAAAGVLPAVRPGPCLPLQTRSG